LIFLSFSANIIIQVELRKAYRIELDPNNSVRTILAKHAGTARFAWNWSLARRIERFKNLEGKEKFTNSIAEHRELNALKGPDFPWMYEVSKCAPQEALRDLDRAFKNFWARRKEGVGFPKFKKKYRSKDSFRLTGSIRVQDRYVVLPRLGVIRLKERTLGRVRGKILSATVSRVADRWFVSLTTIDEIEEPRFIEGTAVGIDLGIKTFAVCSDGSRFESPKALEQATARLRRAQRAHSRKTKGSRNRRRSAQKIAKIHMKVANVRRDFLHKVTSKLAKTKSIIVIEDLNVKGMIKNRCLSFKIMDAGWGEFRRQLGYKTGWYGSKLMVADRWYPSSKRCSDCGEPIERLALSVREWACPSCGVVHDRDENASKNLESLAYPEFPGNVRSCKISRKPVENPLTAKLTKVSSTSYGSLKQEVNIKVDICQS
jgi:putative transposase